MKSQLDNHFSRPLLNLGPSVEEMRFVKVLKSTVVKESVFMGTHSKCCHDVVIKGSLWKIYRVSIFNWDPL